MTGESASAPETAAEGAAARAVIVAESNVAHMELALSNAREDLRMARSRLKSAKATLRDAVRRGAAARSRAEQGGTS